MALKLFNTLSRSVQEFAPLDPTGKTVGMYCCGPTVYDFAHIGNWRTFVFADLVRRYLEFKGHAVQHVMNITDVDDKIIKGVRESRQSGAAADENKTSLREFTGKYEAAFFEDLKTLNCKEPHQTPRATEHIPEIISLIEKLTARGIAYKAADGSVYFSIEKYRGCGCNYGQLLKLNFEEMRAGERVKSDDYAKESVADFALWKARVPEDGDVFWPSPWGEGRPGWHIECSAMSMKILGQSFDLHLGGEDLIFPHHEDEIAQSEGATGKPFVKYWLHGAFLLVEGKKMSKSLGNFFTLRDLLAKGFTGREIRYQLLTAHYRETFNFTLEGLMASRKALARIDKWVRLLRDKSEGVVYGPNPLMLADFLLAMDDDFNVSKAWGALFEEVRFDNAFLPLPDIDGQEMPPNTMPKREQAGRALAAWNVINEVFGIAEPPEVETPQEIVALLEGRQTARKAKDFKRSDSIRDELKVKGWVIEDTPKGPKLKRI